MADRKVGEGDPVVPKEVFELDKDERWQARLEEARARREVALREKAAGKPQKPRPKPWEIEGAAIEKPPEINPVIQERGDDKFDFADRLETIREPQAEKPTEARATPEPPTDVAPEPPRDVAPEPPRDVVPEPVPEFVARTAAKGNAPEPRARPQPSLILPGAPDVAELAARYAATLDAEADLEPEPLIPPEPEARRTAELVSLPTAAAPSPVSPVPNPPRGDDRRGIRPLGMAFGLLALAVLPLTTEAPPLDVGPKMPKVDVLRLQPALGVTWSLYDPPFQTRSGDWRPGPVPRRLTTALVPLIPPADVLSHLNALSAPSLLATGAVGWRQVAPVSVMPPATLAVPEPAPLSVPVISAAPAPLTYPQEDIVEPTVPEAAGAVSAPPRPATILNDGVDALPQPVTNRSEAVDVPPLTPAPQARPPQTVVEGAPAVEADPLRVTILAPARVDQKVAEELASDVQNVGHELVRVKDVQFNINQRNLRYFHETDRASAARMAERYDAELRDFTWFRPRPAEGTAELWLAGRAPGGSGASRSDRPAEQEGILGRVFESLGLGTELPKALPRILPNRNSGN